MSNPYPYERFPRNEQEKHYNILHKKWEEDQKRAEERAEKNRIAADRRAEKNQKFYLEQKAEEFRFQEIQKEKRKKKKKKKKRDKKYLKKYGMTFKEYFKDQMSLENLFNIRPKSLREEVEYLYDFDILE